jgi:hypothetical protein
LDQLGISNNTGNRIAALGRGDDEPASSSVRLAGIGLRPPAPVHPQAVLRHDGSLALSWTRRARGAWEWRDGVDVPLVEEAERYIVTFEAAGMTLRSWTVGANMLTIAPQEMAELRTLGPGLVLARQQGTFAMSLPLRLTTLD